MRTLALIAGEGKLPRQCFQALQMRYAVKVYFLAGHCYHFWPQEFDGGSWISLSRLGAAIRRIKRDGCDSLCTAGKVHRPQPLRLIAGFDLLSWQLLLSRPDTLGDDRLLRWLVSVLRKRGLHVVSPEAAASGLKMPQSGRITLTRCKPGARADVSIATGRRLLAAMSIFDIGQAAVVYEKRVIAVEAAEGTQQLLERSRILNRRHRIRPVLVKIPKSGQLLFTDMPAVGVETVEAAFQAGCEGIALQDQGYVLIEPAKTIACADSRNMFITVYPPEQ